jgi:hypothetical protein
MGFEDFTTVKIWFVVSWIVPSCIPVGYRIFTAHRIEFVF